jgi:hypothetical protein
LGQFWIPYLRASCELKSPLFRGLSILRHFILRTWIEGHNVNLEFHLMYNCRWILDSILFNRCRRTFQMTYSLEDISELPRGLLGVSKSSQKADSVADISRTFMCKLNSHHILHFGSILCLSKRINA